MTKPHIDESAKIGFLAIGNMGEPMAANLLASSASGLTTQTCSSPLSSEAAPRSS